MVLTTCAYGVLIKEPLLSDYEMLNVHPSLLPRWRGAAPIERAIMAGDAETGVTIMRVTAGWDSGPIYLAAKEPIHPDDDYGTLAPRLETLGAELLVKALDEHPTPAEQDEALVTYAHKIGPRERALDPTQAPEAVERTVRALRPHIGARLPLPDGSFLGVIAAEVDGPTRAPAGGLVRAEGLTAAARLPRWRARADRGAPARWPADGRRRLAARPPGPGARQLPLRPGAAGPRPGRGAGRRARRMGRRGRRMAAARVRPGRSRDARRAGRADRARIRRGARDARARRLRPRPARPGAADAPHRGGGRAARDGPARARPARAGGDRLRVRPPRCAARPRLAASGTATTPTTRCARRSRSRSAAGGARTPSTR